jgi:hypothetical protein
VGVAEVDGDTGGDAEAGVSGHLAALIPGQRAGELGGESHDVFAEALGDVVGGLVVEFDQHSHPGAALDQGGDRAGAVGADDQVTFPVAGHRPVGGLGGPFGDVHHPCDVRSRRGCAAVRAPSNPSGTQTPSQFLAERTSSLDEHRLIDRLVRHPPLWIVGVVEAQSMSDLLW